MLTHHCEVVRGERIAKIIEEIGIGQIVKEKYNHYPNREGTYTCITDTGVTLVKTEDKQLIITMYVTTYRELVEVYGGNKKIPVYLRKKVDRNQSKYTKHGKTIWK